MNVKIVTALLILAVATILALVSVLLFVSKTKSCNSGNQKTSALKHNDQSLIFSDLTHAELDQVVAYLKKNINENLVDISKADPSSNCIYSVELLPPSKKDALLYLDKGGPKPRREAMAVVYFGSHSEPEIMEYVVGPLPNPTYKNDVTLQRYKGKLPYHRRPVIGSEYKQIRQHFLLKEYPKAKSFLKEVLGYNESDSEYFAALTSAPRGFASGERQTWFGIFLNTQGSGFFLHPTGLELLFNHKNLDYNKWSVEKVFYNGEYLQSLSELEEKFKKRQLKVVQIKKPHHKDDIASLNPPKSSVSDIPLQYEPQGARFSIKNNQVLFHHWSFAFGVNVNRGLRLYDIKFKGERIVYELSIQEAISVYGSNAPTGMSTRYMDGHFGIGRSIFQLVRGIDCPYLATFIDTHYLLDSDSPVLNKGSICIFELNTGIPLRRHFSSLGSSYYGGLANTVLIIRTIATLGNYDYVFDFMFYQNGAIESKVHATGYISTSFFMDGGKQHGNKVGPYTLGTIHTHFINYKVDLDVGGINNSLVAHDMEFQDQVVPWNPEWKLQQTVLTKKVLASENQAAFQQHGPMPRYMQFASKQKNKWDHERSFRIQMVSFAGDYLPEKSSVHNSMNWAKYKLAVTKHKEEEHTSSSIYNQNDPWSPTVQFSNFINNENIIDEDLVAWITTGFLHIPHAEDIPNTVTAGNGVGFYLRPYNYFNEDPSVFSEDAVYFQPHEDLSSCSVNPLACLSQTASCAPKVPQFTYNGFDNEYIIL
ncbi:membrane primary amine oxidase-like isoform X1 [Bufo gargarizans]|uniref:membrane primary amine oxidase-like isoform X1 n=1 Tax=Bufo gargarizans TaxID=30331 RepID=UPI001CF25002|nr:membrane primary amine oxidase-like isoform X1 [Bufo gargarizans]